MPDNVHHLHVQQHFTCEKPEDASGVLDGGRCQAQYVPDNVQQLHVQQPFTYEKPEAASAVLGS